MNSLDTISGVAFGTFLLLVAVRGNSEAMISLAKRDKSFLKWAIAVGILWYLYSIPELKGIAAMLIFGAFAALALQAGDNITRSASQFWKSL